VRTSATNSVPQGRLRVAQDAVLGRIYKDELVPQGRLKVAQDGSPGYPPHFPKSPQLACRPPRTPSWATFSRPCGTGLAGHLHPGLRPGLFSAVPAGLNSTPAVLTQTLKPSKAAAAYCTAKAVPFVSDFRKIVRGPAVPECFMCCPSWPAEKT
jgi:hypothetical protein